MTKIIKPIVFILLCVSIFFGAVNPFFGIQRENKEFKTAFDSLYGLNENTVDVLFISPSSYETFWQSPKAYNDTGIASFGLTASLVPFSGTQFIIKQALKTQNPKLIVIDLIKAVSLAEEISAFTVLVSLEDFNIRSEAIDYLSKDLDATGEKYDTLSFHLPFLKFHNNWKRLSMDMLTPHHNQMFMGYLFSSKNQIGIEPGASIKEPDWKEFGKDPKPVGSRQMEVLNDLLDYCDTLNCEVAFLRCPQLLTTDTHNKLVSIREKVTQRGYPVIDSVPFYDEIGLDFLEDYSDENHTNYIGSQKFTTWFEKYLKANYDLPDRRGNPEYAFWQSEYERLLMCAETNSDAASPE